MPQANGVYDPEKATDELEGLIGPPKGQRGPVDKRNHLSLVQGHLLQLGNIPRACWEPVASLLNEYYQFRHWGLTQEQIDAGEEYLTYQKDWINLLFTTSQSVDGRQSELMVRGMGADKAWEAKHPASQIGGNPNSGKPESQGAERRGWLGRRSNG